MKDTTQSSMAQAQTKNPKRKENWKHPIHNFHHHGYSTWHVTWHGPWKASFPGTQWSCPIMLRVWEYTRVCARCNRIVVLVRSLGQGDLAVTLHPFDPTLVIPSFPCHTQNGKTKRLNWINPIEWNVAKRFVSGTMCSQFQSSDLILKGFHVLGRTSWFTFTFVTL
jgi:hypothetical protein